MLDLHPRLNSTRETLLLVKLNMFFFHIGEPPDYSDKQAIGQGVGFNGF